VRNSHADDAAVLAGIADIRDSFRDLGQHDVQQKRTFGAAKNAGISADSEDLLDIETAAAELGIQPKRLRGFIFRNRVGDPIGDMQYVYRWSLEPLRKRLRASAPISVAP
jgi:hypothetical protein